MTNGLSEERPPSATMSHPKAPVSEIRYHTNEVNEYLGCVSMDLWPRPVLMDNTSIPLATSSRQFYEEFLPKPLVAWAAMPVVPGAGGSSNQKVKLALRSADAGR